MYRRILVALVVLASLGLASCEIAGSPKGSLDVVAQSGSRVRIAGWAHDPDARSASISVMVYLDGKKLYTVPANTSRPDVAREISGASSNQGFDVMVDAPDAGSHNYCVFGINAGRLGRTSLIGSQTIDISSTGPVEDKSALPIGNIDSVQLNGSDLTIKGWALDPDTTASIEVDIEVSDTPYATIEADVQRPDVAQFFRRSTASKHGFEFTMEDNGSLIAPTICLYARDSRGDSRDPISCVSRPVDTFVLDSIRMSTAVKEDFTGLMAKAEADGIPLAGWGFRAPATQIRLRKAHCGTSQYAIWQMRSSRCSPPTARPGRSMHERGLAVDFTCNTRSISNHRNWCWIWLDQNAEEFGFYNLPSEPWHWSVNGN